MNKLEKYSASIDENKDIKLFSEVLYGQTNPHSAKR